MKIALVSPIEETVPPQKYGGTEWVIYHLAHGLGKKGHQVDLYAPGDSPSEPEYKLIPTVEKALRVIPSYYSNLKLRETIKLLSLAKTVRSLNEKNYDIIHNHASWRFLNYAFFLKQKTVTTHHGPLSADYEIPIFMEFKDHYHVSISNNQRRDLPNLNFVGTVYNGVNVEEFPFKDSNPEESPMIFLARMSREKGAVEAAIASKATGKKLQVYAKVDKVNEEYFEEFKKYIDPSHVFFNEEVSFKEKLERLASSRCLLIPIAWEEPFGLMFTEAMACGTPVITYARGSVPEIMKDGETGFIVNSSENDIRGDWQIKKTGIEGLKEAIEKIYSLSDEEYRKMRQNCRRHVEQNFTVEKMVNGYEQIYEQICNQ